MKSGLTETILSKVKPAFDRQHLIELIMTIGVIGMTIFLAALVLLRFTATEEKRDEKIVKKPVPQAPAKMINHNEIKLGRFSVTSTPTQNLLAGHSKYKASVLQFDASVMVQQGDRSQRVQVAFSRYRSRLNAAVDTATRKATAADLQDPDLRSLRGEIQSNVNQVLGGKFVDDVIVSDFRNYRL